MKKKVRARIPAAYDFSQGKRGAVSGHAGKTRITIWIDDDVLNWFRDAAEREGRGYQTAMNAAMREYARKDVEPLDKLVRKAIRDELRALKAG